KTSWKNQATTSIELVLSNADMCYVASIKIKLTNKKIESYKTNIDDNNWKIYYGKLTNIARKYRFNTQIPASIHSSSFKEIKLAITELYNLISIINAKEKAEYQAGTMRKFIEQRCINYKENKHAMLSSALSRTKRRITLDRIIINNRSSSELITDPDIIAFHTTRHFQTAAGGCHQPITL